MGDLLASLKRGIVFRFKSGNGSIEINPSTMDIDVLELNTTTWLQIKNKKENTIEIYNLALISDFSGMNE